MHTGTPLAHALITPRWRFNMLFCDTDYAKWCKNWLVRKNPPKVTIYNENGLYLSAVLYRMSLRIDR